MDKKIEQYIREQILPHYPINGVLHIAPIELSLINRNFYIHTQEGAFILQRMAKIFTTATVEDMAKVIEHLTHKGISTLELIPAIDGHWYYEDQRGYLWKLMVAVDGETYHVVPNTHIAYEAGKLLGAFLYGLKDFDYTQLKNPLRLHNTQEIIDRYNRVFEQLCAQESDEIFREAYISIHKELPQSLLPATLPWSVVHGDPKISNFIFGHGSDGQGICMIDLDTTMHHTPLVDIGDGLRSWCGQHEEDPNNTFALDIFEAAMRGYFSVMPLSPLEVNHVYTAIRMITLELAARFATDVVDDNYFGWNDALFPSRKAHNRARAYSMVALARDVATKEQEIRDILHGI
ncbi:MAG: aminoglycoside phosphotransferase family protein [Candidatus Kerfeldbacteria bacterium]|nr:aminoglycoside phosphotransferase family protein [Candidatus Kerfeldbacteria bacterium]